MRAHQRDQGQGGRGTAVVVGASVAGLCAAKVLSSRFSRVIVLDRDTLPAEARWRGQVPQGRHPHLLLVSGARLLEQHFPGMAAELRSQGAVEVDICGDFYWFQNGGAARRPVSALRGPAMSRPLLETTLRRRVRQLPNVDVREDHAVVAVATGSGHRITGVHLADRSLLECDLLVDATGRQARSLDWLAAHGFAPPATSVVEVDTRYVSRTYRRVDDPSRTWRAAAVVSPSAAKRLAMALPIEGDSWVISLVGVNGEPVPTDPAGMMAFAESLGSPVIAQIMAASEPLSEPATHRFPANQRRHVERLRHFPAGWVLLGDAVCSFDPIYGQGMTSAALQAQALGASLDRSPGLRRDMSRRYFRAASRIVSNPWSIAVGGDFVYPGTTGKKPAGTDLFNRYWDRMMVAWQHDDAIVVRANEVMALLRSPGALLTPPFVARVLRAARRGPAG